MSDKKDENKPEEKAAPTLYQLDDSALIMIREMLQLALLTQTNIVDQFRTLRFEVKDGKIVSSDAFVKEYNRMIADLTEKVDGLMQAAMDGPHTDQTMN